MSGDGVGALAYSVERLKGWNGPLLRIPRYTTSGQPREVVYVG